MRKTALLILLLALLAATFGPREDGRAVRVGASIGRRLAEDVIGLFRP